MTFLLILSSIAVSHGLFWAFVLLGMNSRTSNRMLSLLLIMLSLRVGKSVAGQLLPEHIFFFSSVGQVSMAAIGPALYHFVRSLFDSEWRPRWTDGLHYLPAVLLPVFTSITDWAFLSFTYRLFTAHVMVYVVISIIHLRRNKELFETDDLKWKWSWFIILAVCILWVTFVCQMYFYQPLVYDTIVVSAAVIFYSLSWYAIPRSRLFIAEQQKKIADARLNQQIGERIEALLANDEIFIDSNLTVTSLAAKMKCQPYAISRAVNQHFDKTFSELVAEYRVKKAEQLLVSDKQKTMTVEAVAYESGFNTLSAFYKAFKKKNGVTPNVFRESTRE